MEVVRLMLKFVITLISGYIFSCWPLFMPVSVLSSRLGRRAILSGLKALESREYIILSSSSEILKISYYLHKSRDLQ